VGFDRSVPRLGNNRVGIHGRFLRSENTGRPERIPTLAGGIGAGPADNQVIQQVDVDRPCRVAQLTCHLQVGGRRGRVARGMVVLCCVPSYVE